MMLIRMNGPWAISPCLLADLLPALPCKEKVVLGVVAVRVRAIAHPGLVDIIG